MRFDLAQEGQRLAMAAQFLTRVPVPVAARPERDWLARSAKYFPLIGVLVGAVSAATLLAAGQVWPSPIPAILAMVAGMIVTGALHEDGLADTADGLGGRTPEARLAIMKDSRLGSFGAIALLSCLSVRIAALAVLPLTTAAAALVAAGAGGRLACVIAMATLPYAGDRATAKVAHGSERPRAGEVALAGAFGVAPLALLSGERAVLALLIGAMCALLLAWRARALLGGYTGDVLGAIAVVFETGALLGASVSLRGVAWT